MGTDVKWECNLLKQIWDSMYSAEYYKVHNNNLDTQGLFLLLEGAFQRVYQLAIKYDNTTANSKRIADELDDKNKEIETLKLKLKNKDGCDKCNNLKLELAEITRQAKEAENRMHSIAKILCLGNFEANDNEQRNTALSLVSQMLDGSPKRKRKCLRTKSSPIKENLLLAAASVEPELAVVNYEKGNIIPDTVPPVTYNSPLKIISNLAGSNASKIQHSSSINLPPIEISKKKDSVRKNLSADDGLFNVNNKKSSPNIDKKKGISFNIDLENFRISDNNDDINKDCTMEDTLLNYVKESRSELDRIWFNDSVTETVLAKRIKNTSPGDQIVESTPLREDNSSRRKKRADFWLLKEKRELLSNKNGTSGANSNNHNKKLKQTQLELVVKQKHIDISKMDGFNGGCKADEMDKDKDDDIIPASPPSSQCESLIAGNNTKEIHSIDDVTNFQPTAFSTQLTQSKPHNKPSGSEAACNNGEPNYVYKRDAVKKPSERVKLPGWQCQDCDKYYKALCLSPSKIQTRLNSCSRHRDKFKPKLNNTPPGFWNPIFPDTQECKDKGMYTSVYYQTDK